MDMAHSSSSIILALFAVALSMAASARGDCSLPCSCAFGVEFGESLCNYANTTMDVYAFQAALSQPEPDLADALDLYLNGRYAFRNDLTTKRTMYAVTHRNYGEEAFYNLSATYFNSTYYIDDVVGAALRGEGKYASACCGVRAEVAKAGARWFSAAFGMHEYNAGLCFATGCNNRTINFELAAEEMLHSMAVLTGADSNSTSASSGNLTASTSNPATLFQSSNAAGRFYCTTAKKAPLSPLNLATIEACLKGSAAAKAKDVEGAKTHYQELEGTLVARFLQYSLQEAREASKPAAKSVLSKAGTCRSPCLRAAQQAAALTYFQVVEPIIARGNADLVDKIKAVLTASSPLKTYKTLVQHYKEVASSFQLNPTAMLIKCKA